jgi:nitrite reductase (NADH) small subunit
VSAIVRGMALVKVTSLDKLPAGEITEVSVGDVPYAVCNAGGELHCLGGICPHAGGPLGQGALSGDIITCPWHEWQFNCATGANTEDEDLVVDKYPVVVNEGIIYIDVPE